MTSIYPAPSSGPQAASTQRSPARLPDRERDAFNLALLVAFFGAAGTEDLGEVTGSAADNRGRPRAARDGNASGTATAGFASEFMDSSAAATRGIHPRRSSEPSSTASEAPAGAHPASTAGADSEPEPAIYGRRTGPAAENAAAPARPPATGDAQAGSAPRFAVVSSGAIGPSTPATGNSAPAAPAGPATKLAAAAPRANAPLVIPFHDVDGSEGRIRLTIRGDSLSATIFSSSRELVRHLGDGIGALERALAGHGFGHTQVAVRESTAANTPDPQFEHPADRSPGDPPGDPHQRRARDHENPEPPGRSFTAALPAEDS